MLKPGHPLLPRLSLLAALAGTVPGAFANPAGEVLVSGSASVTRPDASTVRIDQATPRAILNWDSFSTDAGELVQFVQPSASAAFLNRVTGGSMSQLFGQLQANGRVLLVNPNGIMFGAGGQVDVAGLVASTLDISDANFNADHWQFDATAATPGTLDVNGTINAADGGFVALLSQGRLRNFGSVNAPNGGILLATGSGIFVDPVGDGLVLYQVTNPAPDAGDYVDNLGSLTADNGHIVLAASVTPSSDPNQGPAVFNEGNIRARAATVGSSGEIILVANGGPVAVTGTLDTSGPGTGTVTLSGTAAFVGAGNTPTTVQADVLNLTGAGRIGVANTTLDTAVVNVTSDGIASFDSDQFPSLNTFNATVGTLYFFTSTVNRPSLDFNITGSALFAGTHLSGGTLHATASNGLSFARVPNLPPESPPLFSSLSFTQQISLDGGGGIGLYEAVVDAPVLNLVTGGYASLGGDQLLHLQTVHANVGVLNFFESSADGTDVHFDVTGGLLFGGAQLSGDSLQITSTGGISIAREPNLPAEAAPVFSGLHFTGPVNLDGTTGSINLLDAVVDTPDLSVKTTGIASLANNTYPSLQAFHAQAGTLQLTNLVLNRPDLTLDITGPLLLYGATLSGSTLHVSASQGLFIGRNPDTLVDSRLTFSQLIDLRAPPRIDVIDATLDTPSLKLQTDGIASLDRDQYPSLQTMTATASTLYFFDSTVNRPSLDINVTGDLLFGGARLSGGMLQATASHGLALARVPNLPAENPPIFSSLDFTQQISLAAGDAGIGLYEAMVDTPALNLVTPGYATLNKDQFPSLQTLSATVGTLNFFDSTASGPSLAFNVTGDLLFGGAQLSGGSLRATASGGISVARVPNLPPESPPLFSSLNFSQDISLNAGGSIGIYETPVAAPLLNLVTPGVASIGTDQFPSLQTLNATVATLYFFDSTLNRPSLAFNVTGDALFGGARLSGGSLSVVATGGVTIGNVPNAPTLIPSSLDYTGTVDIKSGGTLNILGVGLKAGDLSLRSAGYLSIDNSAVSVTQAMLLESGADLQIDVNTQTHSTLAANAVGMRAAGGILLGNADLSVGTGIAPFGADRGMLGKVGDSTPDRLPVSAAPNASFTAPQLVLGPMHMSGDYLFIQANRITFNEVLDAPLDLLVNMRPMSRGASVAIENTPQFRRDTGYSSDTQFNYFPGTTIVVGGTDYDGFIFIGEGGPVSFANANTGAPHNPAFFFMTNGLVAQKSQMNTSGPVVVLAGIDSALPDTAQDENELKAKSADDDDEQDSSHEVRRVTRTPNAKECR